MVGIYLRQSICHGLLARVAAMNHARGAAETGFADFVLQHNNVVRARGDEEIRDGGAGSQAAKSEDNQRQSVQFEELLG